MLGKLYVDRHFKPEAKARMEQLVENLRRAFREGIDGLEWMGPETKKQAQEKLAKFRPKIGYPNKWRDYSRVSGRARTISSATSRARSSPKANISWRKVGKPIDPEQWGMTPQTVNAYYNPVRNEIVFPAAILQPPFFNLAGRRCGRTTARIGARDRPRDGPRLRRSGPALRRQRRAARLVDAQGRRGVHEAGQAARRAVQRVRAAARAARQRRADARREHRRPDRRRHRASRLSAVARRQAGAGDRRPHGRSALSSTAGRRAGAPSSATMRCGSR